MKKKNKTPVASRKKRIRKRLHPHFPRPRPLLDTVRIVAIAHEHAHSVADTGSPGAEVHNTKLIAGAISAALAEIPRERIAK